MNLKWFWERWSHFSIFVCRLLLTQWPTKYTYVPRNPAGGRTWWLERSISLYKRLILRLKIAPQLKGLFHAICYLFRKLQFNWTPKIMVQLCYLLPSIARMDMDWNVKKLRQRLQVLMLYRQIHKKILLWLVLSDETCWALPHNSTRAFCAWVNTQSIIVT